MKQIIKIQYGSHLYGTSTLESDMDFKGIYLPTARDIVLQKKSKVLEKKREKAFGEKNNAGDEDEDFYSLSRYMKLLAEGQTVALDMVFAPERFWIGEAHPLWYKIISNKEKIVSKNAASFLGYCRQQASKFGVKGSRLNAVRRIVEWFDSAVSEHGHLAKLSDAEISLRNFLNDSTLEHTEIVYMEQPNGMNVAYLECCNKRASFFATLKDTRAIFVRVLEQYGDRARKAEKCGYSDWKSLSHAVRVGLEAIELLETGHITLPLKNAQHILNIKLGKIPYFDVAAEIDDLLVRAEDAQARSTLRELPDLQFIEDFIFETYGQIVYDEIFAKNRQIELDYYFKRDNDIG